MNRTLLAAVMLAGHTLPAQASPPLPPVPPIDCSGLAAARAEARAAAKPLGYLVTDLDGDAARKFQEMQGSLPSLIVDHVTIITNVPTGRSVALIAGGPKCSFNAVGDVLKPWSKAIDAALDALRPDLSVSH